MIRRIAGSLGLLVVFHCQVMARSAELQTVHSEAAAAVSSLRPAGRPNPAQHLQLAISLPLRNQQELSQLLADLQDPASPNYRHYLTPAQFTKRFGPTQKDYDAVAAFAAAHHLAVSMQHPNRLVLDVDGAIPDIETALHVTVRTFQHPIEARQFYAPDTDPRLELAVPISHISGLDNYELPHPCVHATKISPNGGAQAHLNGKPSGSGLRGSFIPGDFWTEYGPNQPLTGFGQAIALVEFDGFDSEDVSDYMADAGIVTTPGPLTPVLLDGFDGRPTRFATQFEVTLDVELAGSMAYGLGNVLVYEGGPNGRWEDILNRIATDNLAAQVSCSWLQRAGANPSLDAILEEMAAQGQSFFTAAGDYDAYAGRISFPADSPYVTSVGGTTLNLSATSSRREIVWNTGSGRGSGGGISTQYGIPSWQQLVNMALPDGSNGRRNIPDVAMVAENVFAEARGNDYRADGTSCAAPLWASYLALINQMAQSNGQPRVGFINPIIYAIGVGPAYTTDFHAITRGDNFSAASPGRFHAMEGYNLCTGWGTPSSGLAGDLIGPYDPLQVSLTGFKTTCRKGGPVLSGTTTYMVANLDPAILDWTASASADWLSLSATSGTLPGSASTAVIASLNSNATALADGWHSAQITFTNTATGVSEERPVYLEVTRPAAVLSATPEELKLTGTAGESFSQTGKKCVLTNIGAAATLWEARSIPGWLDVTPNKGTLDPGESTKVTFTIGRGASKLRVGQATGVVKFADNEDAAGSAVVPVELDLKSMPPAPEITGAGYVSGAVGGYFAYAITASNDPAVYSATNLPQGLTLDSSTGIISGTLEQSGTFTVSLSAANLSGTGLGTLSIYGRVTPLSVPTALNFYGANSSVFYGDYPSLYLASGTATAEFSRMVFTTTDAVGNLWTVNFSLGNGAPLVTGTYGASALPSVSITLIGFGETTGLYSTQANLVISDLQVGSNGQLISFAADFLFWYGSASYDWLAGSVRFNSTVPLPYEPPPVITSATTVAFAPDREIVQADINAEGLASSYYFNYGLTPAYGNTTSLESIPVMAPLPVVRSGTIGGLQANTTYHYQVVVTNPWGAFATPDATFTTYTSAPPPPVITSGTSLTLANGTEMSYQITASNNPVSYSVTSHPAGLQFDPSTGVISGTPSTVGTSAFDVYAMNASGTGSAVVTLDYLPPIPAISSGTAAAASPVSGFYYKINASNGPAGYGATGLPPGLTCDPSTGFITGTATETGTFNATLYASNAGGPGSSSLQVVIGQTPPPNTIYYSYNVSSGSDPSYYLNYVIPNCGGYVFFEYNLPTVVSFMVQNLLTTPVATFWTMNFRAPTSAPLTTGTTYNVDYSIFETDGPDVSAQFTILDLEFNPDGSVATFAVDFTENVEGGSVTFGSLRYNSTVPVTAPYAAPSSSVASFALWQRSRFSTAELAEPKFSGAMAAPAGDGVPNLLKYALNIGPKQSLSGAGPELSVIRIGDQEYPALTYVRWKTSSDLRYTPEVSTDLHTWHRGEGFVAVVSVRSNADGVTQTVTVRSRTPISGLSQQYLRMEVTKF